MPKIEGRNLEYFINKANLIHNKYDYSLIKEYKGFKIKYDILCKDHGVFQTSFDSHINKKSGCPKCKGIGLDISERCNIAHVIHNNKYDYSLITEYKGTMVKYPIICKDHGIFNQTWDNHTVKKSGCPKCKGHKLTYLEKINQANKIHNSKYDYSSITKDFKTDTIVPIICKEHGLFKQLWTNHIHQSHGCPQCATYGRKSLTFEDIKEKILGLGHDFEYDWDSYKGYYDPGFRIKCPKHGWFNQQVSNHLFGQRCKKCNNSKGEDNIELFLKDNNIEYTTQKTFNECINPETNYRLKFDFYLPKLNICVEYDGEMHYNPVKFFGGQKQLDKQIRFDKIKNQFCKDNNMGLIRISYIDFSNINLILKGLLNLDSQKLGNSNKELNN